MLDRALAKTFSNFSTLFLLACIATVPAHAIHAYIFKDVLSIRELSAEVSSWPEGRQVRGVDRGDIAAERTSLLILLAGELALLVVMVRAGRYVIAVADRGGVPEVMDALKHLRSDGFGSPPVGPIAIAGAFACICAWLVWQIGELGADVTSADATWAAVGLVRGVAVGTFIALAAGSAAALSALSPARPAPPSEVDVY